jgi:hypothetical protein
VKLDFLAGFKNVLSGDDSGVVAAGSCGMFVK